MNDIQLSMARTGEKQHTTTCLYEASPHFVFGVIIDPALIPDWWGPAGMATTVEQMDLRRGGSWRFIQRHPTGVQYVFHGIYQEVIAAEQLVYTFEFEGMPGHIIHEAVTLTAQGGKTLLTDIATFYSAEDLDAVLVAGMEAGMQESMQRLTALLMRLKQQAADESSLPRSLSNPARRALAGAGIENIEQLAQHTEAEIKELHGIGPSAMDLLQSALTARGLSFTDSK
jgi:uncharacterized protein YndB with AHSA1/START domain